MRARYAMAIILAGMMVAASGPLISEMTELLWKARTDKRLIPVLSMAYPNLDPETAYKVQKAYVSRALANDRIGGFKMGLNSLAIQKRFGLTTPMAGVLLESGRNEGAPVINRSRFRRLALETEVAFEVGSPIAHSLRNVAALRERIRAVMPAVEFPELGFADMKHLKGVDIISANAAAAEFLVGISHKQVRGNFDPLLVVLSRDGREINRWEGAMGSRWESALWLVNEIVARGWRIEPGHILMTGTLGNFLPGKAGKYVADYGKLGRVSFEVR